MESIYQFKLEIRDSLPSIWRRMNVASDTLFSEFRDIIHIAFQSNGDPGSYQFNINKVRIIDFQPEIDNEKNPELKDSDSVFLDEYVNSKGSQFQFTCGRLIYDIILEEIFPEAKNIQNPCCISGERASPPIGLDIVAFQNIIKSTNTNQEIQKTTNELLEPNFDPGYFDIDKVNDILQEYTEEWEEIYDEVGKIIGNGLDEEDEDENDPLL